MKVLYINKAKIEKIPIEIGGLQNLSQLIITNNLKQVNIPSEVGLLSNLKVLTLRGNVAVSLPMTLSRNQYLEYLDLSNTNIKDIKRLMRILPQVEIVF